MWKVKNNITFEDLKKLGFIEETFGLYGSGDYIPEHWYEKTYYIGRKKFYISTNHRYFLEDSDTLNYFRLYKDMGYKRYDKIIPLKGCRKIVRIVLKDLLKMGLIEKV